MKNNITDKDRVDFLQRILVDDGKHTGKCVLILSSTGRGFRLHESSNISATDNVRQQIDDMINRIIRYDKRKSLT